MRRTEADWIAAQLLPAEPSFISPLLNIGSSTAAFREHKQPHIEGSIFAPLRRHGVDIVHTDLKQAPGVDVAGDLMDPEVHERLRARGFKAAISSNLLEHVRDPRAFARAIASLVVPGGLLVVTVPYSYPYHADPIDTGFRPTPAELAALFDGCTYVRGEVVRDTTYAADLTASGLRGLRGLVGALRPWGDIARAQRDRLRWLFRPFSTSCVVLRTPGAA